MTRTSHEYGSMRSGLTITDTTQGTVTVLSLKGYLDGHTYVELERRLDKALTDGTHRLVVDLAELTYIASAGVGVFINGQHQLRKAGGSLQLVKPNDSVREIFNILGIESLFVIHDTLAGGVTAAAAGEA
jgi:anti-sigma B factor antagonist